MPSSGRKSGANTSKNTNNKTNNKKGTSSNYNKESDKKNKKTNTNKEYSPSLVTPAYKEFKLSEAKWHKASEKYEPHNAWDILFMLYPYEFVNPRNVRGMGQYKKTVADNRKKVPISYWFDEKTHDSILMYNPLTQSFSKAWEVVYKYKLADRNSPLTVLEISTMPSVVEAVFHFRERFNPRHYTDDKYQVMYIPKYVNNNSVNDEGILNLMSRFIPIATTRIGNSFSHKNKQDIENSDLVVINPYVISQNIGGFWEEAQQYLLLQSVIYGVSKQVKNGNMLLIVSEIKTKFVADVILILKKLYQSVELYRVETQANYKQFGVSVICKNYNGKKLEEVNKQIFKVADNIVNSSNKLNITSISKSSGNIPDILNTKLNNSEYDFIRLYNQSVYQNASTYINNTIALLKEKETHTSQWKDIQDEMTAQQLVSSVMWANKFNMKIKSGIQSSTAFKSQLGIQVLGEAYQPVKPRVFKFKMHKNQLTFKLSDTPIPEILDEALAKSVETERYIDTRDIELYDQVKRQVKLYRKHLTKKLTNEFNAQIVTQAWLKMYEMLTLFDLFDRESKDLAVFFICEAPGGFIAAVNQYVSTMSTVETFTWNAQSLNPFFTSNLNKANKYGSNSKTNNNKTNSSKKETNANKTNNTNQLKLTNENRQKLANEFKKKDMFGNHFGLIAGYPQAWDFGADKTGDITHVANIKYYAKYLKHVNFVTSDCGIPMDDGFKRDANVAEKIVYGSVLTILNGLKKGGNAVIKMYMDLTPIKMSILYILYDSFEQVYFYKSLQNAGSTEFYVVGKNYKEIPQTFLTGMFKFLENFDYRKSLVSEYPNTFTYQLAMVYKDMANARANYLERTLFYVDNYHRLSKSNMDELDELVNERDNDWLEEFPVQYLEQTSHL